MTAWIQNIQSCTKSEKATETAFLSSTRLKHNSNVILHIRIIVLIDLMAMMLPIRDPGFESREIRETIQTP